MMAGTTNKDSIHILKHIPRNSVGAEIGVWMGNSSKHFLSRELKKLYLVDSWSVVPYKQQVNNEAGSYDEWLLKYSKFVGSTNPKEFEKYYDNVYEQVCAKFEQNANVVILRKTSEQFFEEFTGELLDWIYIDGDHSYEGCLCDLRKACNVIKPGGIIFGDDYKWPGEKYGKPGVMLAVDQFCKEKNLKATKLGHVQFMIRL